MSREARIGRRFFFMLPDLDFTDDDVFAAILVGYDGLEGSALGKRIITVSGGNDGTVPEVPVHTVRILGIVDMERNLRSGREITLVGRQDDIGHTATEGIRRETDGNDLAGTASLLEPDVRLVSGGPAQPVQPQGIFPWLVGRDFDGLPHLCGGCSPFDDGGTGVCRVGRRPLQDGGVLKDFLAGLVDFRYFRSGYCK